MLPEDLEEEPIVDIVFRLSSIHQVHRQAQDGTAVVSQPRSGAR